jgi:hypothetical protein
MSYRNLTIAVVESLGVLLINILVAPLAYAMTGATVSTQQAFFVSGFFFLLRILWFYFVLAIADRKTGK